MFGKEAPKGILAVALSGGLLSLLVLPTDPMPTVGNTSYLPVDLTEPFPSLRDRLTAEKAPVMARQLALLRERYDLSDRPAPGVTMARGKPVQAGVRVKLPPGMTWDRLAGLDPATIRERDLFPKGFLPLPHPIHPSGGMIFPHSQIEELLRQENRDLTRFDVDFDLPDPFLPEFPPYLHDGRLLTLEDTVEFFNLVLELKLKTDEKADLVAFLRQL